MTLPRNARRNAEIIRLKKAGWAACDIARLMNLTRRVVGSVIWRAGLSNPTNNPAKPGPPKHLREQMAAGQRRIWSDPERREHRLALLQRVKPWVARHAKSDGLVLPLGVMAERVG